MSLLSTLAYTIPEELVPIVTFGSFVTGFVSTAINAITTVANKK